MCTVYVVLHKHVCKCGPQPLAVTCHISIMGTFGEHKKDEKAYNLFSNFHRSHCSLWYQTPGSLSIINHAGRWQVPFRVTPMYVMSGHYSTVQVWKTLALVRSRLSSVDNRIQSCLSVSFTTGYQLFVHHFYWYSNN